MVMDTFEWDLGLAFYLLALERKVYVGVGNCKFVLCALQKGIYEIFHYNYKLRTYGKT